MNDRAQQIRQKRLKEREEEKKKEEQKRRAEAESLFDWVLDLFANPTLEGTYDKVVLICAYNGKIQIGYKGKTIIERPFDDEVMKILAEMFNAEEGYDGEYCRGNYPISESTVTITIE